jgi:dihydropteroate synthase
MGVLNVTPDSFSDGGKYATHEAAIARGLQLIDDGADALDIGGESTRPGAYPVDPDEQIRRVVPVIAALAGRSDVVISIDTTSAKVAQAALEAGASLINDISGASHDPNMLALAAHRLTPIVLMHMQGKPLTMQDNPRYADVVAEVSDFLLQRRDVALAAGIESHRILFDPGIGFGKTDAHSLALLRHTDRLAALGQPLLVGVSRKGFIGRIAGEKVPSDRLFGTAAANAWCAAHGAAMLRVHDVAQMKKVLRIIAAIAPLPSR